MKKLLFIALLVSIQVTANAAEGFSTLEERMSGRDFMETGLSKLTDEELAALNDWIRRHSVATLDNASARPASAATAAGVSQMDSSADMRGFENQAKLDDDKNYDNVIHGNIAGKFTGWAGNDTEFRLTNGMVWKQVEGDTFNVKATENAEVTIKKGIMGGWRLSMVGYNNTVRVKRIK